MNFDPYAAFKTDPEVIKNGICIAYPELRFRVTVALMDETNKGYTKFRSALIKPLQHKIDTKTISDEEWATVMRTCFAHKGILLWEVEDGKGNWKTGVFLPDGSIGEATPANYLKVFESEELERVYTNLLKTASDYTQFRKAELEEEKKGSSLS